MVYGPLPLDDAIMALSDQMAMGLGEIAEGTSQTLPQPLV